MHILDFSSNLTTILKREADEIGREGKRSIEIELRRQ